MNASGNPLEPLVQNLKPSNTPNLWREDGQDRTGAGQTEYLLVPPRDPRSGEESLDAPDQRSRERHARVFSAGQRVSIVVLISSVLLVTAATQLFSRTPLRDSSFESLARGLRGKQVVMIGDSLMRYKYLTLVSFLETGIKLSTRSGANQSEGGTNNPVDERTWISWDRFYNGTTFSPGETCDCWRQGSDFPHAKENRHYVNDGYDISYYQVFSAEGTCAFRGHSVRNARASPVDTSYDWCYSFGGFMAFIAKSERPDIAFLNSGLWGSLEPSTIAGILDSIPHIRRIVWLTTTAKTDGTIPADHDVALTSQFTNQSHVTVSDAWSISTDLALSFPSGGLYWDSMHFYAFAYEIMLQNALLQVV